MPKTIAGGLKDKYSDLHAHLNGCFSLSFLEIVAERNNVLEVYEELVNTKKQYQQFIGDQNSGKKPQELIKLIWRQFEFIHKIIQNLTDIREGTINVIKTSTAKYMEIRTTPKEMGGCSWKEYVDAFIDGLQKGNDSCPDKIAHGMLSLDRTCDTKDKAFEVIDRVVAEKNSTGWLVGVDIGGNPDKPRTLSGEVLKEVLNYALSKNIGIAIHVGEVKSPTEEMDIDIILQVLTLWYQQNLQANKNPLHKKVRLGHGIFLNEKQQSIIRELQIPFEICPSCHEKIHWWKVNEPHPVLKMFGVKRPIPVVSGVDDSVVFDCDAKGESIRLREMQGYTDEEKQAAKEHQAQFRFG